MKKTLILIFCTFIFSVSSADTSNMQNKFFGSIENFLNESFVNTDFSIKSQEHNKPEIGILTIKPLIDNDQDITFLQGSFFTHDGDRETFNLGLGKRNLINDENLMLGLNAFYDHELDYDHQRGSIGGEIKSSILELNTNHYFAISDTKTGKNNLQEEVVDGYDLEIGAHVPYIPSAKIFTKYFEYDLPGKGNDFKGLEYSSNIGIPNSGVNLELGYKDLDNSYEDRWFFALTFNLNKIDKNKSFISKEAYEKISMKDKKYEKVRRENLIVKKKGFSVKAGGF
jgi:adhesin/invasin